MSDIFERRAKVYNKKKPVKRKEEVFEPEQEDNPQEESTGILSNLLSGLKGSAPAQLLGYQPEEQEELSMADSLARKAGTLAGDIPAMSAGSVLGGGLAGLFAAGPLGAAIGAGAGAFGLPELIKQVKSYFRKPEDEEATFSDKLGDIGDIGLQTAKQSIIGGVTGGAGRLFPFLAKIPGLSTLAKSKVGRGVLKGGTELAAMTGASSALEGELPSVKEVMENAMLLGGMKVAGAGARGLRKIAGGRPLNMEGATPKSAKLELDIFKQRALKLSPKSIAKTISIFKKQKPYFEKVRTILGDKNARIVESMFKWNEAADKTMSKEKFTPKQMEEAIYFIQKTGNPRVKGDSFKALSERIPDSLKKIINVDIDPHLKKTKAEINKHKFVKDINARKGLEEKYLTGLYEPSEKTGEVYNKVSKEMGFKNMFANMKTFLSYNEAFKKAGLVPRYKNIFELVHAYDKMVAKTIAGGDFLAEISKSEKANGTKLIVTDKNPEAYNVAKAEGYVPFEDMNLRQYSDGKISGRPSVNPALVAPEVAGAIQGIFNKEAFRPKSKFWKAYDTASDIIRFARVRLSFFHYVPLTESSAAALGAKKALSFRSIADQGKMLRSNKDFMVEAARSGLEIHKFVERFAKAQETGSKLVDAAMKYLPEKVVSDVSKSDIGRVIKKLSKAQEYLFKQYHPNLKAVTWQDFVTKALNNRIKSGNLPTETERVTIKRQMADLVNSMYGGQNWNVQRVFNSKKYRTWLRRAIAYPDWTTSAIRQAAGVMSGGLKGKMSRKYWLKFGINSMLAHGALQFLFGGLKQSDMDKKSVAGIRFDPAKALKSVWNPDPIEWYKFPLPDIPVKIGGVEFNPGREAAAKWKEEGSKLYTHFGKQALEIKGWKDSTMTTLFNKSNPIISMMWKQIMGSTPSTRGNFVARGKWKKGSRKRMPWDATEPGTSKRLISRIKAIVGDVTPFSMNTLFDKGLAPYLATGLGSVPISKGSTPYKAEPFLVRAFKKKDYKKIDRIEEALRDNGYSRKQIRMVIKKAKTLAAN